MSDFAKRLANKLIEQLKAGERLLGASQAKIQHSQGGGAFYRPSTDTIHLPSREQFEKAAGFYATALHELGHWTGLPNRLNRDLAHPLGVKVTRGKNCGRR